MQVNSISFTSSKTETMPKKPLSATQKGAIIGAAAPLVAVPIAETALIARRYGAKHLFSNLAAEARFLVDFFKTTSRAGKITSLAVFLGIPAITAWAGLGIGKLASDISQKNQAKKG